MCVCESYDGPTVFESVYRMARPLRGKSYSCCECARTIKHGDWYRESRGLWEDTWDTFRMCLRCWTRREAWAEVEDCQPVWGGGELAESILECFLEEPEQRPRYGAAFRKHRTLVAGEVAALEAARAERYRLAGVERERRKWERAHLGEGI